MKDNFDKILSDKIKEVTSKNEIPYNPEHWNLLQTKMKKEKKRVLFYWQIAAFLLIALLAGGIGNYLFNGNVINKDSANPQIILDTKNDSLRIDSLKTNRAIFITSSDIDSVNNNNFKQKKIDLNSTINNQNSNYKKYTTTTILETNIAATTKTGIKKSTVESTLDSLSNNLNNNLAIQNSVNDNKNTNDLLTNIDSINLTEKAIIQKLKKDSLAIKKDILAVLEEEKEAIEPETKKSLKYGLEVSPIFDYNQDNGSSNVGFAGGITVEIPISSKFDVNTGIFYADQKLNLNKPSTFHSDAVSAKSNSQLITKEAVIKGIEIPLNIKYNFSVVKKDFFIAAGVTSTSYIKENIEANYLVNSRSEINSQDYLGNNIVKYKLVQTNSKVTTSGNSSTFNFANYLNVSLGIKLPVNNQRQAIIIAPYFKYSLKPLTQQQIDFNSGGVHLRYNFSFSKK